jgi:hypothetical protein
MAQIHAAPSYYYDHQAEFDSEMTRRLQMLPAVPLAIKAPTGSDQIEMGVVRPIAAMRVEHYDVAPLQHFAPDLTNLRRGSSTTSLVSTRQ